MTDERGTPRQSGNRLSIDRCGSRAEAFAVDRLDLSTPLACMSLEGLSWLSKTPKSTNEPVRFGRFLYLLVFVTTRNN
jgi:hypothetical protein